MYRCALKDFYVYCKIRFSYIYIYIYIYMNVYFLKVNDEYRQVKLASNIIFEKKQKTGGLLFKTLKKTIDEKFKHKKMEIIIW